MPLQGVGVDSLRHALDSVFATKPYRWVEQPNPFAIVGRWWEMLKLWVMRLDNRCPQCVDVLGIVLIAILIAILVHVLWIFVHTVRAGRERNGDIGPGQIGRDQHWYRREADRLASLGRFADAMQADFLALVLALDASRVVKFHPSKTPAEYLAESRLPQASRDEFRELVSTLYGYAFARWPCNATDFANWRSRVSVGRYAATQ